MTGWLPCFEDAANEGRTRPLLSQMAFEPEQPIPC